MEAGPGWRRNERRFLVAAADRHGQVWLACERRHEKRTGIMVRRRAGQSWARVPARWVVRRPFVPRTPRGSTPAWAVRRGNFFSAVEGADMSQVAGPWIHIGFDDFASSASSRTAVDGGSGQVRWGSYTAAPTTTCSHLPSAVGRSGIRMMTRGTQNGAPAAVSALQSWPALTIASKSFCGGRNEFSRGVCRRRV